MQSKVPISKTLNPKDSTLLPELLCSIVNRKTELAILSVKIKTNSVAVVVIKSAIPYSAVVRTAV